MANWNSFIKLISVLQLFTRIGAILWSVTALILTAPAFYVSWMFLTTFLFSSMLTGVSVFSNIVLILFVAMIPQTIHSLAGFVKNETEEWEKKLKGPGRLIFSFTVIPVLMIFEISQRVIMSESSVTSPALAGLAFCALNITILPYAWDSIWMFDKDLLLQVQTGWSG